MAKICLAATCLAPQQHLSPTVWKLLSSISWHRASALLGSLAFVSRSSAGGPQTSCVLSGVLASELLPRLLAEAPRLPVAGSSTEGAQVVAALLGADLLRSLAGRGQFNDELLDLADAALGLPAFGPATSPPGRLRPLERAPPEDERMEDGILRMSGRGGFSDGKSVRR